MRLNTGNSTNFVEHLHEFAITKANEKVFTFLNNGETAQESLTYAQLDNKARFIAGYLQKHAMIGDRILLCYLPGLDFISAFIGCLYAGMIAVPAYPMRNNHYANRLLAIINDCNPSVVLGAAKSLDLMQQQSIFSAYHFVLTDTLLSDNKYTQVNITADMLAFLQYTSGSTGMPKGAMVSHSNLLANLQAIDAIFQGESDDAIVSWLPMQHDMGLIGQLLYSVYVGITGLLMSPNAFLEKPLRWLNAISSLPNKVVGSAGPNFGYQLCVDAITEDQLRGLDLSRWQVACTGSEPIRAETLKQFSKKFAKIGFQPTAFLSTYGMAETTLLISGQVRGHGPVIKAINKSALQAGRFELDPSSSYEVVSSGQVYKSFRIKIVNPKTGKEAEANGIGEIWINGPCVCQGYWNKAHLTQETFQAHLLNDKNNYFRTGDLGYLYENELYITGRLKDLIILQGQNIYPQDVEAAVEASHPAIRIGTTAAFSIEKNNQEQLIIVTEIERTFRKTDLKSVLSAIRQAVLAAVDVIPFSIHLLPPTKSLRTTSGKIQRGPTKLAYEAGTLSILAHDDIIQASAAGVTREKIENDIKNMLAKVLDVPEDKILSSQEFLTSGATSLQAIMMVQQLQAYVGNEIPLNLSIPYEHSTLSDLTDYIFTLLQDPAFLIPDEFFTDAPQIELPPLHSFPRTELMPLSLNEKTLWMVSYENPESANLNMKALIFIKQAIDENTLEVATNEVITGHELLRTTYQQDEKGKLYRCIHQDSKVKIIFHDLHLLNPASAQDKLLELSQALQHKIFILDTLPLFEMLLVKLRDDYFALIFCMHHIIGDGRSMEIFLNEIMQVYQSKIQKTSFSLPPEIISYTDYVLWQKHINQYGLLKPLVHYWENKFSTLETLLFPYDNIRDPQASNAATLMTLKLNPEKTREISQYLIDNKINAFALFSAAIQLLIYDLCRQESFLLSTTISSRIVPERYKMLGFFSAPGFDICKVDLSMNVTDFLQLILKRILVVNKLQQDCGSELGISLSKNFPNLLAIGTNFHSRPLENITNMEITIDPSYFTEEIYLVSLDLFVDIWEWKDSFSIDFVYRSYLFDKSTIVDFSEKYLKILDSVLKNPKKNISDLIIEFKYLEQDCEK